MPRERRAGNDLACLLDMLDAARAIQRFLSGKTLELYQRDELLRAPVERKALPPPPPDPEPEAGDGDPS